MLIYPLLSIYEKTSLLGTRMSQLENGAKSTLSTQELLACTHVKEIALMELKTKKLPIKLIRENEEVVMSDLVIV